MFKINGVKRVQNQLKNGLLKLLLYVHLFNYCHVVGNKINYCDDLFFECKVHIKHITMLQKLSKCEVKA